MTDMGDPRLDVSGVRLIRDRLQEWLRESALPLWELHGVDRREGGFFETLRFDAGANQVVSEGMVRRGRVVARQIYTFAVGRQLGWRDRFSDLVDHGCDYLLKYLLGRDGLFFTSVDAATRQPLGEFSLYEHAFYLFALATVSGLRTAQDEIDLRALECLERLRARCGKPGGGFYESSSANLPLQANPHMHLLEAALAWIRVSQGPAQQQWIALAGEVVRLCLTYFVDAQTGAVREYFDHHWQAMPGDLGRIIEPGHQFEWAWLLLEWASSGHVDSRNRKSCMDAARKLVDVGERWGVEPIRGVAVNAIWDDMSIKDSAAKIWPQTERLKAWCALLPEARSAAEAQLACHKIVRAGNTLADYLLEAPVGLWHEVWCADGSFAPGPSKASSFYHIACAIDVLRQTGDAKARDGGLSACGRPVGIVDLP